MTVQTAFHDWYLNEAKCWKRSTWMGQPVWKSAADLLLYQQVIHETRPNVIIELGTGPGGSAVFFHMLQVMNRLSRPLVVTVDVEDNRTSPATVDSHATFVRGSSTKPETKDAVLKLFARKRNARVMLVCDSDHRTSHVLAELKLWADVVTPDCYAVVEDGNHELFRPGCDDNPAQAAREFLATEVGLRFDLLSDMDERYGMSFAHGGWLRRVR